LNLSIYSIHSKYPDRNNKTMKGKGKRRKVKGER